MSDESVGKVTGDIRPLLLEEKPKPEPKRVKASWTVRLDTRCPKCGHRFDLFACQDWLLNQRFDIGEFDTLRTTDVEVECPKCGHEFEVTFDEW